MHPTLHTHPVPQIPTVCTMSPPGHSYSWLLILISLVCFVYNLRLPPSLTLQYPAFVPLLVRIHCLLHSSIFVFMYLCIVLLVVDASLVNITNNQFIIHGCENELNNVRTSLLRVHQYHKNTRRLSKQEKKIQHI